MRREYRVKRILDDKTGQATYLPQTRKFLPWWSSMKEESFTRDGKKMEIVQFYDSRSASAFIQNYRLYRLSGNLLG